FPCRRSVLRASSAVSYESMPALPASARCAASAAVLQPGLSRRRRRRFAGSAPRALFGISALRLSYLFSLSSCVVDPAPVALILRRFGGESTISLRNRTNPADTRSRQPPCHRACRTTYPRGGRLTFARRQALLV